MTTGRKIVWAVLIAIPLSSACSGDPDTTLITQRDSAGIHIVESSAPRWSQDDSWVVDSAPALDLSESGTGPAHEFFIVSAISQLDDGRFVVASAGSDDVRLYASSGQHLTTFGREGEGPGEFKQPASVQQFRADSLVVWDRWLRRITVVDDDLNLGRVSNLPDPDLHSLRLFWAGDSTFIASLYTLDGFGEEPGYYRMPEQVARIAFDSERYDTLATLAGGEGYVFERGDARPPFGRSSYLAVRDGRIVVGDADHMEVRTLGTDGAIRRIMRVPSYDLSISGEDLQRERESLAPEGAPEFIQRLAAEMPVPETKPAYMDLKLDPRGHVWVQRFVSRLDLFEPQVWEVFDPQGAWLGAVELPERFWLQSIEDQHVLGIYYDEFDVQHPRVHRLVR